MITIGFIDYYLNEWHAEKYPAWIEEASAGRMKVAYAYGLANVPGRPSNAEWCERKGITLLDSIAEVVERCDALVVLSPDNPEYHEELSQLPLRSGKPVFVDKTFAPDLATAKRLFALAEAHGTPMYSTSALRYAAEYGALDMAGVGSVLSFGPGKYGNYAVHQAEPIVALLGTGAERVMWTGTADTPALVIGFADGRQATMHLYGDGCPFGMAFHGTAAEGGGKSAFVTVQSDFFAAFIAKLVEFFDGGEPPVAKEETLAIAAVLEAGEKAAAAPFEWIAVAK
ncbi:Gfo/Idh/MocA family oxidoreductase [Paenibacillus cymbidii]|uniref:Gfo/Idh/MocA family oxidoreductase n=1 Tax=Paenibacillus cymbidii TaxID=1639034 RepID=UPI001081AA8C|nr:Gfo/Idh/MocA family oxidoreductase [Paenibacillus cymbidii]